jgi:beta-barrel assembly-enhancing protease
MIGERACRAIGVRLCSPVLQGLVTLLLLQPFSAAQINPLNDSEAGPGSNSTVNSGTIQGFKSYQDTSTRHFSAIQDRDMGCARGLGKRYSLQAQMEMGRSYAQKVESNSKLITDPLVADYVNRLGQNLAQYSDAQVPLTFRIIDKDEVNAFSLPGGFIFVNSGLILAAENEAELAGVLSHEMAHVAACHAAQEMAREERTNVAAMPLILRIVFRRAIRNTVYSNPTRSFESEADLAGLKYLQRAGYDPQALPSFFEKIRTIDKEMRGSGAINFESHPQIADRISRTRHEIKKLLPPGSEYKLDTSEFQETKQRLFGLQRRNSGEVAPELREKAEVTKVQ